MKILIIHNYYSSSSPSGENIVVDEEAELLESKGHEVEKFIVTNDYIASSGILQKSLAGISYLFNIRMFFSVQKFIRDWRPDVIHIHNLFPLISPSVFYACGNTPVVVTLHNYRLGCITGQLRRGKNICTKCIDNNTSIYSLIYGCYRDSSIYSLPLFLSKSLHEVLGTWRRKVDRFIALTNFQKEMITRVGIDERKIIVRPNYFKGTPQALHFSDRTGSATFVGRVSEEKGIMTLINAWKSWGSDAPQLTIVGDGPLLQIAKRAASGRKNIVFRGRLENADCVEIIKNSKLLIVPSIWFEGFPMVIREAFAHGVPVLASDIGSLSDILSKGGGCTFTTNDEDELFRMSKQLLENVSILQTLSDEALKLFNEQFSEDVNYIRLMDIYNELLENAR